MDNFMKLHTLLVDINCNHQLNGSFLLHCPILAYLEQQACFWNFLPPFWENLQLHLKISAGIDCMKIKYPQSHLFKDCFGFIDGTIILLALGPWKNKEDYRRSFILCMAGVGVHTVPATQKHNSIA
ncbi:hypothetical protein VP01_516g1 [Puccinia sorghi]|uniref:Uncharacterized protein n=1 Tax=Puccinia sorghi TaxID=27349 RepID=A0A0L6UKU4_9BASI|nr:hypothetical protein VP01_516g1 [Puccinia sorghi]